MREERKRLVWSSFALARYGGHHPSLFWLAEPKLTRALGKPERRMVAQIPEGNATIPDCLRPRKSGRSLVAAARRLIAPFEASQKVAPSDVVYSDLSVFSDARQRTELHPVGCAPTGRVT